MGFFQQHWDLEIHPMVSQLIHEVNHMLLPAMSINVQIIINLHLVNSLNMHNNRYTLKLICILLFLPKPVPKIPIHLYDNFCVHVTSSFYLL